MYSNKQIVNHFQGIKSLVVYVSVMIFASTPLLFVAKGNSVSDGGDHLFEKSVTEENTCLRLSTTLYFHFQRGTLTGHVTIGPKRIVQGNFTPSIPSENPIVSSVSFKSMSQQEIDHTFEKLHTRVANAAQASVDQTKEWPVLDQQDVVCIESKDSKSMFPGIEYSSLCWQRHTEGMTTTLILSKSTLKNYKIEELVGETVNTSKCSNTLSP